MFIEPEENAQRLADREVGSTARFACVVAAQLVGTILICVLADYKVVGLTIVFTFIQPVRYVYLLRSIAASQRHDQP